MLNRMMIQILRQWGEKTATNPFPVAHMPDNLTEALKAAAAGVIKLNDPVATPEGFRGKVGYDKGACIGCNTCIKVCPANAIEALEEEKKVQFHMDRCCFCAQCTEICPVSCIWMTHEFAFSSYDRKAEIVTDSGKKPLPQASAPVETVETKSAEEAQKPQEPEKAEEPGKSEKPGKAVELKKSEEPRITEGPGKTAEPMKAVKPQKAVEPEKAEEPKKTEEPEPAKTTRYEIDHKKCIGCTKCVSECPVEAISGKIKHPHSIDWKKCVGCGACAAACPVKAIHTK
ncbi:MAG: 4Fe-4S binding protein [Thermovirgaceae bacterium]|nr:4Fe-4S binding protein [Thermovirgaceae bacterium]